MTLQHSDISFLKTWGWSFNRLQEQAAVAVVIPTTLRPTLARAISSVFAQEFDGRIQLLIGIDVPQATTELLDAICCLAPSQCIVQAFYPGYSTSVRHNGQWEARDGGALRTILSYLANAPLIAYLDDDNWWGPRHLDTLARAIEPVDWAFSLRWFVHPETARPICVDRWESVGPNAGIFNERFGGFVDANCLMIKAQACARAIPWWTVPLPGDPKGMSADRHVFEYLNRYLKRAATGEASAFYVIDPTDGMHPTRLELMGNAYRDAGPATATLPPTDKEQTSTVPQEASVSAQEVFSHAVQHHQAGRLAKAESKYWQALTIDPFHAASLDQLGVIAYRLGQDRLAVELITRAISCNAHVASFHSNLGSILEKQGRLDDSISCLRRAIELKPGFPEAHNNLGIALQEQGHLDQAISSFQKAIELRSDFKEARANLSIALKQQRNNEVNTSTST